MKLQGSSATPTLVRDRDACLDWARGMFLWHADNQAWGTREEVFDPARALNAMLNYWRQYRLLPAPDATTLYNATPTYTWFGKERINEKPGPLPETSDGWMKHYRAVALEVKTAKTAKRAREDDQRKPKNGK